MYIKLTMLLILIEWVFGFWMYLHPKNLFFNIKPCPTSQAIVGKKLLCARTLGCSWSSKHQVTTWNHMKPWSLISFWRAMYHELRNCGSHGFQVFNAKVPSSHHVWGWSSCQSAAVQRGPEAECSNNSRCCSPFSEEIWALRPVKLRKLVA